MQINSNDKNAIEVISSEDKKVSNKMLKAMSVDDLLEFAESLLNHLNQKSTAKIQSTILKSLNKVIAHLDNLLLKNADQNLIDKDNEGETNLVISFRHDEGKRMHGAFFDHYVMRKITDRRTKILNSPETSLNKFKEFVTHTTLGLGINSQLGQKVIPESIHDTHKDGLIVIPGYSRQLYDEDRIAFENEIIKKACLRGQPILAICAGSWTLWQNFGGKVKGVEDHVYSSMPYLVTDGGVGNNKQIHRIKLLKNTIVTGVMSQKIQTNPDVNSVHWMAPDENNVPNILEISARSELSCLLEVSNRQGERMAPENNTIEAFETKYGVPMIGVQWHPECYYSKQDKSDEYQRHLNLINYMVKAGDTFQAKYLVLDELKSTLKLRKFTMFKTLAAIHDLKKTNSKPFKG